MPTKSQSKAKIRANKSPKEIQQQATTKPTTRQNKSNKNQSNAETRLTTAVCSLSVAFL